LQSSSLKLYIKLNNTLGVSLTRSTLISFQKHVVPKKCKKMVIRSGEKCKKMGKREREREEECGKTREGIERKEAVFCTFSKFWFEI
jgi:hypothetical protein